ncbi:MAG: CDP-glucose 4,6-dehydratase [Methylocystis sp.]
MDKWKTLAGRRVLLTGHTGFKGAWLALWLDRLGAEVYGFALPPEGDASLYEMARVGERLNSTFGDLNDLDSVEAAVAKARPQIVFHLAAQAIVRRSHVDPLGTLATNVMGAAHLLQALRGAPDVSTILVVTSDKVYANDEQGAAFAEDARLGGKDPYSASKAAAELVTRAYAQSFFKDTSVKIVTARGGNVIGGGDYAADRIVPDIVRAAAKNERPVLRMPHATRPWQHVLDCLHGYLTYVDALERGERLPETLNFGPDPSAPITVGELTEEMLKALGRDARYEHQPLDSREMNVLAVDSSRARALLKWRDRLPGRLAINWTADWYRDAFAESGPLATTLAQIDAFEKLPG